LHIAQLLQKFYKNNYKTVAMEASSHALDQSRLYGLTYDILALTNISHDHLDYHKSLNNYINAKLKLFIQNAKPNGILIISKDTQYYPIISKKLKSRNIKYLTFGLKKADFEIKEMSRNNSRVEMQLNHASKKYIFKFNNLSNYQIKNYLLATSIVNKLGYEFNKIKSFSLNIPSVPGRMELAGIKKNKAKVFVDFAHTPDALENVLNEAKQMSGGKLHVVFGCGGDRDKKKRPLMGKIACKYADSVVVTDDNPRNENPQSIRNQIIGNSKNIIEISDRKKAIKYAINNLLSQDILIIAGKGHEKYQLVKNKSLPFDDVKISKKYI
nr:UDP-N-acetylmuramoyl-L-alanyl-D-glutamate--2,6-diaminopimelate ligase [Pelagibacterales bacterium]